GATRPGPAAEPRDRPGHGRPAAEAPRRGHGVGAGSAAAGCPHPPGRGSRPPRHELGRPARPALPPRMTRPPGLGSPADLWDTQIQIANPLRVAPREALCKSGSALPVTRILSGLATSIPKALVLTRC